MCLISAEGYKNADVQILIIKKTSEIWPTMKELEVVWVLKPYLI